MWFGVPKEAYEMSWLFIDKINAVLAHLSKWGIDNRTTFEPDKMSYVVVSNRRVTFDELRVHTSDSVTPLGSDSTIT